MLFTKKEGKEHPGPHLGVTREENEVGGLLWLRPFTRGGLVTLRLTQAAQTLGGEKARASGKMRQRVPVPPLCSLLHTGGK